MNCLSITMCVVQFEINLYFYHFSFCMSMNVKVLDICFFSNLYSGILFFCLSSWRFKRLFFVGLFFCRILFHYLYLRTLEWLHTTLLLLNLIFCAFPFDMIDHYYFFADKYARCLIFFSSYRQFVFSARWVALFWHCLTFQLNTDRIVMVTMTLLGVIQSYLYIHTYIYVYNTTIWYLEWNERTNMIRLWACVQ